jgi:hypothetical protein
MRAWNEATRFTARSAAQTATIQRLVMADAIDAILAAGQRNAEEGRLVTFDGLFDRS